MANLKKYLTFLLQWEGDGTNKQVVIAFLIDPVFVASPGGYGTVFSVASSLPASISNITVSGATLDTFSYVALTGLLTVKFVTPPTSGTLGNIVGYAEYA